jgi:hypothetical protein
MKMANLSMMIKCTLSAGCFDVHGSPPVQYEAHLPMQYVQGYTRSHWPPPLGDYFLRIAPAATANKTTTKTCTHIAGHFDGHGSALVQ